MSIAKVLAPFGLAMIVMAGSFASAADAASRSGSATGPRGKTFSSQGTASCVRGAGCASTGTYTGPRGNTVNRRSGTTCSGGVCNRNSTWSR